MTLTLTLLLLTAGPPLDPKLYKAFENAAKEERTGCMKVPYKSQRKLCKSSSAKQDAACIDFSCDLPAATKATDEIRKVQERIRAFEKTGMDENDYSRDLRKKLVELEKEFGAAHGDAADRARRAHNCAEARQVVRSHFARLRTKVSSEKEYGSKKFKHFKKLIVSHFEDEELGHLKAIKGVRNAQQSCRKVAALEP